MKAKLNEQILMQRSVMDLLESNLKLWQNVEALKKNYDRFVRNIKRINDLETELNKDSSSLKAGIDEARKRLFETLYPVASVLNVYASETGNNKLIRMTDLDLSDLENMKNSKLLKLGNGILKSHNKLILLKNKSDKMKINDTNLQAVTEHYGLTQVHTDNFQEALKDFSDKVENFEILKATKTKACKKLNNRARDNENILTGRIDKIMTVFMQGNKKFFNDYQKIRLADKELKASVSDIEKDENTGEPTI